MRKQILLVITVILIMLINFNQPVHSQVIFSEDFDNISGATAGGAGTYAFPSGWLLRNVDNLTPYSSVSYVNEAWERREDFSFNVSDSCAFSTSYYSPAGSANDFMWTPLIGPLPANSMLSWNAVAYDPDFPDGYEVRIMTVPPTGGTGDIGNQITNSTSIFSTGAEATSWTNHQVSLSAYTGQTVYIGFRNISNDMFLLLIDDITVEVLVDYDASLLSTTPLTEYTMIPLPQATGFPLEGTIKNEGLQTITNVSLKVNVYDNSLTQVFTNTSTPAASLASGASQTFNCGTFTPAAAGNYLFEYFTLINETDQNHANDTLKETLNITDTVYARDDGASTGSLGIGAQNGGYLGQQFTINTATEIHSVTYYIKTGYLNEKTAAVVWNMSAGAPNSIIASTDTIYYPITGDSLYTLPISGGPVALAPGDYVVTVVEFDSTLALATTTNIFTAGKTWVDWPTNPNGSWSNNEDFGFDVTYIVRANLYLCPLITATLSSTNASCSICADGTATAANPTGGVAPYTYVWSNAGTSQTISNLSPGNYDVTIYDASGCSFTGSVNVGFSTDITDEEINDIAVMPNPNNGEFNLIIPGNINTDANIEILNSLGQIIYENSFNNDGVRNHRIDLGNVPSGNYFLRFISNKQSFSKHFIIK